MLFLMRGKLLIEWDLTFNSMYKHICILIKVYLVFISAIHKNSILNQMGVVNGRGQWACQSSDTTGDM